jgi:hypothetical protein
VFDGYDGHMSAHKCIEQLHLALLSFYADHPSLNHRVVYAKDSFKRDEINDLDRFERGLPNNGSGGVTLSMASLGGAGSDKHRGKSPKNSVRSRSSHHSSRHEYLEIAGIEISNPHTEMSEEELRVTDVHKEAFKRAYKQMDKLLSRGKDETSKKRWSGATACTCIVENRPSESGDKADNESWIHLANCGKILLDSNFSIHA